MHSCNLMLPYVDYVCAVSHESNFLASDGNKCGVANRKHIVMHRPKQWNLEYLTELHSMP